MQFGRISDKTTGHGCYPAQDIVTGSPSVFTNGIPTTRIGDIASPHTCEDTHGSTLVMGFPSVFINGINVGIISSNYDCGSLIATGSPSVGI